VEVNENGGNKIFPQAKDDQFFWFRKGNFTILVSFERCKRSICKIQLLQPKLHLLPTNQKATKQHVESCIQKNTPKHNHLIRENIASLSQI
jgi:hypothetical protein